MGSHLKKKRRASRSSRPTTPGHTRIVKGSTGIVKATRDLDNPTIILGPAPLQSVSDKGGDQAESRAPLERVCMNIVSRPMLYSHSPRPTEIVSGRILYPRSSHGGLNVYSDWMSIKLINFVCVLAKVMNLPKQSQHNPNSCLEKQHACSQSYCHPIGAGEPEKKKLNWLCSGIVGGKVGIAIPTFLAKSRQLGIVDFLTIQTFRGSGLPS